VRSESRQEENPHSESPYFWEYFEEDFVEISSSGVWYN